MLMRAEKGRFRSSLRSRSLELLRAIGGSNVAWKRLTLRHEPWNFDVHDHRWASSLAADQPVGDATRQKMACLNG